MALATELSCPHQKSVADCCWPCFPFGIGGQSRLQLTILCVVQWFPDMMAIWNCIAKEEGEPSAEELMSAPVLPSLTEPSASMRDPVEPAKA